jgi:putative transposase
VFAQQVYLVFVTKYRRKVFHDEHLVALERIMRAVCAEHVLLEGGLKGQPSA